MLEKISSSEEALKILRDSYFDNIENRIQILVFGEASNKKL